MDRMAQDVGEVWRRELFDVWRAEKDYTAKTSVVYSYLQRKFDFQEDQKNISGRIWTIGRNLCKQFTNRWRMCNYNIKTFEQRNSKWLNSTLTFDDSTEHSLSNVEHDSPTSERVGRPRKAFEDCSLATKKVRVQPLLQYGSEHLSLATQMCLYAEGKREAAAMLKTISESPEEAKNLKQQQNIHLPTKLTPEETLAYFVQSRLTKQQYLDTRELNKKHNADIYPNYHQLLAAKEACYPKNMAITETIASVELQELLNHTMTRLLELQKDVLLELPSVSDTNSDINLLTVYKWGCDGAAAQSEYKQKFKEESDCDERYTDSFLFEISIVPIRITYKDSIVVWNNPRPSSTRYCRPIKIMFAKETPKLVQTEVEKIKSQIQSLHPTELNIEGRKFSVQHDLHLTMIDGKVCSYLTGTGSATCYICGAKPRQMNLLESHLKKLEEHRAVNLGMSSLHAWIKIMECILHISYRLETTTWQVRKEDLEKVKERKKKIQEQLRQEMGLLVDVPKQGFGTTNDGNTARRFFANPRLSSQITGVSADLIYRLGVILRTISSGFSIDVEKFHKYALETATLYIQNYGWYYMPVTLHKILVHGSEIIKSCIVPIGRMSEEAQESRHREAKRFREHNTRKTSRLATMEDLIHMLLITSDPLINSYRKLPGKPGHSLPEEVRNLLQVEPNVPLTAAAESDSA